MDNTQPVISIITPSYNQGDYIEQTIRSIVEEQDYPNIEYIIMDGGSNDNTVEIIKKYEDKIAYWESEKDKGQTDAINKGWRKATGDIITWLCSDDYYEPNIISKVIEAFKDPNINLVCGNRRTFGDGISDTIYKGLELANTVEESIFYSQYDQPPSFFRKEAWDAIFPLSEVLQVFMDNEMQMRYMFQFGVNKAKYFNELFANGRFHANSKSVTQTVETRKVALEIQKSIINHFGPDEELKKMMDQIPGFEKYKPEWKVTVDIDKDLLFETAKNYFLPYAKDPSYIYRNVASYFLYLGNAKAAASNCKEAIKKNPFKVQNYRDYLYCIRN